MALRWKEGFPKTTNTQEAFYILVDVYEVYKTADYQVELVRKYSGSSEAATGVSYQG